MTIRIASNNLTPVLAHRLTNSPRDRTFWKRWREKFIPLLVRIRSAVGQRKHKSRVSLCTTTTLHLFEVVSEVHW